MDSKTTMNNNSATTLDPIQEAARRLLDAGVANAQTLKGCSETEIATIEKTHNLNLPESYRRFLSLMGRGAGQFLIGTDFLYKDLPGLRKNAEILLHECKAKFSLFSKDFVFAVHQGYEFLFFSTGNSTDPPVFLFVEDDQEPKQVASSFSEWLLMCVGDEIATYNSLKRKTRA